MLETQLRRIYAELLGDLVDVDFEREARLRRPVAPFRSTRRLVRKRPCALELVAWNVIGDGLQRPRVDRKSTRLNSSHGYISYAVFCLKKKKTTIPPPLPKVQKPQTDTQR